MTARKQARLVQVAGAYLAEQEDWEGDWRIDVVAIDMAPGGRVRRLEIIRNAVSA